MTKYLFRKEATLHLLQLAHMEMRTMPQKKDPK